MKYLCIDVETSSIKPENGELLSFAAVLEDTSNIKPVEELPFFYCVFRHKSIKGEPYALNMNRELIREISEDKSSDLINMFDFNQLFNNFLHENGVEHWASDMSTSSSRDGTHKLYPALPHNVKVKDRIKIKASGKNFGTFDKGWIEEKITNFNRYFQFNHRVLDPGSLMVDFKNDEWIPNLNECMKRAGVKGEVTHNALKDCYDLLEVIRTKY